MINLTIQTLFRHHLHQVYHRHHQPHHPLHHPPPVIQRIIHLLFLNSSFALLKLKHFLTMNGTLGLVAPNELGCEHMNYCIHVLFVVALLGGRCCVL